MIILSRVNYCVDSFFSVIDENGKQIQDSKEVLEHGQTDRRAKARYLSIGHSTILSER